VNRLDTRRDPMPQFQLNSHKQPIEDERKKIEILMSENENAITANTDNESTDQSQAATTDASTAMDAPAATDAPVAAASTEDISYHAVEKDGQVTAIWEMQGRKHLRTIDPRSHQGQDILRLYTSEHHEEAAATTPESTATAESAGA